MLVRILELVQLIKCLGESLEYSVCGDPIERKELGFSLCAGEFRSKVVKRVRRVPRTHRSVTNR